MKKSTDAYSRLAQAPRRSYLGKYQRLTPSQSRWIRSLLAHWGNTYGGSGTTHLSGGCGIWGMMLTGWTGEQQERIASVLDGLRKIGYSGEALFQHARAIIWPKKSLSTLIGNAGDKEEAEFMERIILSAFKPDNIVYQIGRDYYTWQYSIVGMARWMQRNHAPFMSEKQCIDRVRWCIDLFNSAVFFALKEELCIENAKFCEKDLKTSFESA